MKKALILLCIQFVTLSLFAQIHIIKLSFTDHQVGNQVLNITPANHNIFPYINTTAELNVQIEVTSTNIPQNSYLMVSFPEIDILDVVTNVNNPNGIFTTIPGFTFGASVFGTANSPTTYVRFDINSANLVVGIYSLKIKVIARTSGMTSIATTAALSIGANSPTDVGLGLDVANEALPVNIGDFTATLFQTNKGLLNWNTLSEKNTKEFVIEKSYDAQNWSYLGTEASKSENGYSKWELNYQFMDPKLIYGSNFYRIKMFDFDGSFSYSPVRVIYFSNSDNGFNVFPNPSSGVVYVSDIAENTSIQLIDVAGRQMPVPFSRNNGMVAIDVSKLVEGSYFIIMKNSYTIAKKKIVVVR